MPKISEKKREDRRQQILEAALACFSEDGFHQTGMADIVKRSGLSHGAVYLYFPSKEAILEGLVKRAVVPIADNALAFLNNYSGDPRPVISQVMKMIATRLADPKLVAMPRLLIREIVNFPEFADMYRRAVLDRVIPAVTQLVETGMREGYFRELDPELTLRSIIGPVIAHMLISELFGIRPKDGLAVDRLIENHLTILFDGLSAPQRERRFMAT